MWRRAIAILAVALLPLSTLAAAPPPEPSRPVALLIGDSNIFGALGKALGSRLAARGYDVVRRGKPTSGLSRLDFFDWFAEASRLLAVHTPDVVFFMAGGNDHQRLEAPDASGARIRWSEADLWTLEYSRRVREMGILLARGGRRVFFLSPTNRAPRIDREDALRVSRIQARALEALPGVTFVDTFALSTGADGRWLNRGIGPDGHRVHYRHDDGIHLTREGGEVVADRVLATLDAEGALLDVLPTASGPWAAAPPRSPVASAR